ncbi:MAG: ABC transporter permease [Pirellulaceae bacterium]
MIRALRLAWRYVLHHRFKSLLMVLCIALTVALPIALAILLASFNQQIVARAQGTPLVVGAKGSPLDLTMHAIYFRTRPPGTIVQGVGEPVGDLGMSIPIHVRYTAQSVPVVGTTLEYFDFRRIGMATGTGLVRLGDCVLGARAAERLGLEEGDSLLTDRENVWDIAGSTPLKMRVGGVLAPTRSPDDDVVFVDLKTAWIIEGLGHGHEDLEEEQDEDLVSGRENGVVTARATVTNFIEVTDENAASFHFHGNFEEFPVTALIVVPNDEKGEALMLGRYQREDAPAQMSKPIDEVQNLMQLVFRVQKFFNANAILIGFSTALLLVLVVLLSIRLRAGEMETMFKIGCARGTMASLIAAELFIIFVMAAACVGVVVTVTNWYADDLVRSLLG